MDETRRRRLLIAREVATWANAMPVMMARIADALKMPTLPGRQKLDFEVMARRITASFNAIGETADANDGTLYDRFVEKTDRLRELIAAANAALDPLVKGAHHLPHPSKWQSTH